jgi:hypothetical protein
MEHSPAIPAEVKQQKGNAMSNEDLSAFLSTRGKDGTINAIKWVANWFTKNPEQTPLKFANGLDAGKAVSLYGGYIVSKFNLTPEVVFTMRTVIGAKYSDLDSAVLAGTQEEFQEEFNAVEAEFNSTKKRNADLAHLIGKDTTLAVSSMVKAGLRITPGNHISREAEIEIRAHISHLQSLLGKSPVSVKESELVG